MSAPSAYQKLLLKKIYLCPTQNFTIPQEFYFKGTDRSRDIILRPEGGRREYGSNF